jgi:hypothetical protein
MSPATEHKGVGGGRLSPASLDLDTCGCPTTFGDPACEIRTEWELDKTTSTADQTDPVAEPFLFDVKVTEGPTGTVLTGEGQLVITNSGDQTPSLGNIAILLEEPWDGGPGNPAPAPGPSGRNWTVLAVATESEFAACGDTAPTQYGLLTQTEGSNLILFNPDNNDVIALSDRVEIPPTQDNDGDGLRDEDPVYTGANDTANSCSIIDNDNDGSFDEDPVDTIDNDNDGAIDEDDPNDDGDDETDEDGACEDAVIINFAYEFDLSGLGLEEGDLLRINLLTTFDALGTRGGSAKVDIDCDGDDEDDVRTVQQRHQFYLPACDELCQSVTLSDPGVSTDLACVAIGNEVNNASDTIAATGTPGTMSTYTVTGDVSCQGIDCETSVSNQATLTGQGCDGLISGSPASDYFDVVCNDGGDPEEPQPGDFCSQTQGGWGSEARGNNTGTLRDTYFDTVFPTGLVVGDPDGPDGDGFYSILLTSSAAVADYLPAGGTAAALTADQTDPETTSSGVFGGQLVAATLNVGFDDNGLGKCTLDNSCDFSSAPGTLRTLVYQDDCGVDDGLVGEDVDQVIAWSNCAISGETLANCGVPAGVTISDLSDALSLLNEEFVDCDTAEGCLGLPEPQ